MPVYTRAVGLYIYTLSDFWKPILPHVTENISCKSFRATSCKAHELNNAKLSLRRGVCFFLKKKKKHNWLLLMFSVVSNLLLYVVISLLQVHAHHVSLILLESLSLLTYPVKPLMVKLNSQDDVIEDDSALLYSTASLP